MKSQILGFTIKPDLLQELNPFLVILKISVFEYAVYPALIKVRFCDRPLQKMVVCLLLTALSFAICGYIQLSIETVCKSALYLFINC